MIGLVAPIALTAALAGWGDDPPKAPSLPCDTGPVSRSFGGTQWLVYACADGATVAIVSDTGNPAASFYFILSLKDGHYSIYGEGNGDKKASDAAGDEINALGDSGIRELLKAAQALGKARAGGN